MQPFTPGATNILAVTTTSARIALTDAPASSQSRTVRLHNAGSALIFVRFGDSTVVAAATDMPLPVGAVESFNLPNSSSAWHVAAIAASGTATLYATAGTGV